MKCVKCVKRGKEAYYNLPEPLCEFHWEEWWDKGIKNPGSFKFEVKGLCKAENLKFKDPNAFGEWYRDRAFKENGGCNLGCYSTFVLEDGFKDIDPKSELGQQVLSYLLLDYCGDLGPPDQDDIDEVCKMGRMATDGNVVVAWYWDGDGVLLVGCQGRFAINTDCRRTTGWEWC